VQIANNEERHKRGLKRIGQGYSKAYRLNLLNPLSYIFCGIAIPILLLMYGFIEIFDYTRNPFQWD